MICVCAIEDRVVCKMEQYSLHLSPSHPFSAISGLHKRRIRTSKTETSQTKSPTDEFESPLVIGRVWMCKVKNFVVIFGILDDVYGGSGNVIHCDNVARRLGIRRYLDSQTESCGFRILLHKPIQ